MGKGDKRRPRIVQRAVFESNWDLIFRKKSGGRKNSKRNSINETSNVNNEWNGEY